MKTEEFCRTDEAISNAPYHYRGCGLSGIYLLNGYTLHPERGGVSIKDLEGLHQAIGRHLVMHRKILAPKEIKFLRNVMGITQQELAMQMGNDVQTVARWEKGICDIPGPADKLLRLLYMIPILSADELKDLREQVLRKLQELDQMDEVKEPTVQFKHSAEDMWLETPGSRGTAKELAFT